MGIRSERALCLCGLVSGKTSERGERAEGAGGSGGGVGVGRSWAKEVRMVTALLSFG